MNIKEFQIGDYFRVAKDNLCISKGTVVEIRGIDADNSFEEKNLKGCASCRPLDKYQFNGGIWVEHLEPIPLTAEILEKNGWSKEDDWFVFRNGTKWDVSIAFHEDGYDIEIFGQNPLTTQFLGHLNYLHELQHILTFMKIEKEIEI